MPADTPATSRQAQSPTADPQRLKKRESDRKAQRVSRERTKSRIAYLEDLVQKLSSGNDHDKTLSMVARLSEVTKQRDSLVRFLDSTSLSFTKHLSEAKQWDSTTVSQEEPRVQLPNVSGSVGRESSAALMPDLLEASPATNELSLFSPDFTGTLSGDTALEGGQSQTCMDLHSATYCAPRGQPVDGKTPAASSPCDCTCSETRRLSDGFSVSRNIWQAGYQVLKATLLSLSTSMLELECEASEDVPVRVVLYGWDHLEQPGRMTPLWRRVRQLDEICFSACGQVERLAVIHMVHRYMRAYADPTSTNISTILPRWYMKSTSSDDVSGHPAVDYFAWPSFRRQFSRYPHRYCSNLFWHMFKEHLRITWPYEFRDAYSVNVGLGSTFKVTEGTISDASQGGEDDQGWSYDTAVGEYNWDLENL
ncbi:hypothetical protein FGADI_9558 [Fusarium gaditjirri]|uniref:BZIP transcription factor n=1 Tax=Fusarium gaditjirri TaxID=282569 RepID=A0A8H4SZR0_9HYPO|nr:hypothetical protein FGADI_9558 [Fusarium gaditjirri]